MSRRVALRACGRLLVIAVLALGVVGAVGYGQRYSLRRGFSTLVPGSPGKPQVFVDIANVDIRPDNQMAIGASRPISPVYPDGRISHRRHSELRLVLSLLLALLSAALINVGFVLQHRGHEHARETGISRGRLSAFGDRWWLAGQLAGWLGFAGQVVAVALAPLTLVQAFSAGSLALTVPLAAAAFGHRVDRRHALAIAAIAVSLVSLPLGVGRTHGALEPGVLIAGALVVLVAALGFLRRRSVPPVAILAGALYGVADASIKADSIGLRHGGSLFSAWTVLAIATTCGGLWRSTSRRSASSSSPRASLPKPRERFWKASPTAPRMRGPCPRMLGDLALFGEGPRVSDALPLLQLPGLSPQPLYRVVVSALLTGLALGRLPTAGDSLRVSVRTTAG